MIRSLALVAMTFAAGPALAQAAFPDKVSRSVNVQPGKQVRLGVYANVSAACEAGALPTIAVVGSPKVGAVTIRSGKTKAGALKRCPSLEVPAQGVFYVPGQKAAGADEVVYEVRRADGKTQTVTVKITISDKAPAATDTTEL